MAWNIVNDSFPWVMRSTFQQTDEGLLYLAPTMNGRRMTGLAIRRFELHNRDTSSAILGIGFRWANQYWIAGQWTDAAGTPFTDDTADAQDLPSTTADFQLTTTTANDGFVIASREKFSWVSIRVETAEVIGVGVTHAVRYTNFAGSGWTAVSNDTPFVDQFRGTTAYAAGALEFAWAPPADWGRTQASGLSGIPSGFYALNVRATDAPDTTGGVASVIEVGSLIAVEAVAANGLYANDQMTFHDAYADSLVALCNTGTDVAPTADAGNRIYAEVTTF